jgi:hypothetical protein
MAIIVMHERGLPTSVTVITGQHGPEWLLQEEAATDLRLLM